MKKMNERKIGAFLSYVSVIISTLVSLVYTPFLIRNLGQSEYGLYSLVASIIGYLTILDLGFGNAIIVYTSKYHKQEKYNQEEKLHGMFMIIFFIIGIIATLIGIILYFNVGNLFNATMTANEITKMKTLMLILTFNLAISFPFSIYQSIISAYENFVFLKVVSILNTIIKPLIMIPILFMGYKSIAMAIIVTVINVAVMLLNYVYCRSKLKVKVKYKGFDLSLFKEIFSYSFFIFLGVIVDKVNWSVDTFILGAVSGTIAISLYTVASQINNLFISLSGAFSSILLPKISKMVAEEASDESLTNEFIKVGRIQYLIIFLLASGFVLFGKEFIIAWAGYEYTNSYYIAIILIIPLCIPIIQNVGVSILQAKNMHKFRSILFAFIAISNIIISIPLAKLYSGVGSAIGTSLSLFIGNIIIINIYYQMKAGINIIKFWKEIIKMSIPFTIPVILIVLVMHIIDFRGFFGVVIYGLIYSLLYAITIYKLSMNNYEKNIVKSILCKMRLKKNG